MNLFSVILKLLLLEVFTTKRKFDIRNVKLKNIYSQNHSKFEVLNGGEIFLVTIWH